MDDNILSQTSPSKLSTVQPVEITNGVLLHHSLLEIQPNVPQEDNSQEYLNQSNEQLLGSTVDKSQDPEISEISQNNDHIFKSIVPYSDSESESPETHIPVVKREKRCQVKRREWKNEMNEKQREQGQEYYGKRKLKVTDLRALKYSPNGEIHYKLRFGEDFRLLPQRKNNKIEPCNISQLNNLFTERRNITRKKYQDLQELKNSLPGDFHEYYTALPHE
ncbi:hypothetical protein JTB14_029477 [Gonioctena quinquepunctata]|nr:hypothetical protein JTB14_029477 [Gonioctena quinquepunctata]